MKPDTNRIPIFPGNFKTTLGTKHKRSKAYDNFWLDTLYTKEYSGDFGSYDFDDSLYVGIDSAWVDARKEISDHIPIWVTFYTDKDDD